jgi:hypothetical protein
MKWLHGHLFGQTIACVTGLPSPEKCQQRKRHHFAVPQHIVVNASGVQRLVRPLANRANCSAFT